MSDRNPLSLPPFMTPVATAYGMHGMQAAERKLAELAEKEDEGRYASANRLFLAAAKELGIPFRLLKQPTETEGLLREPWDYMAHRFLDSVIEKDLENARDFVDAVDEADVVKPKTVTELLARVRDAKRAAAAQAPAAEAA